MILSLRIIANALADFDYSRRIGLADEVHRRAGDGRRHLRRRRLFAEPRRKHYRGNVPDRVSAPVGRRPAWGRRSVPVISIPLRIPPQFSTQEFSVYREL